MLYSFPDLEVIRSPIQDYDINLIFNEESQRRSIAIDTGPL